MHAFKLFIGAGLVAAAIPLSAQNAPESPAPQSQSPDAPRTPLPYDRGYDKDSPRTEAIDASGRAGVEAANGSVLDQSADRSLSGADNAQYSQDMAAYRDALRVRRHAINSDARIYDHQQRAYADAMADWRAQVYACEHGSNQACNTPAPDPAAYW